jgi:hypothetical protein
MTNPMKHLHIPMGARLLLSAALLLVAVAPDAPAQPNGPPAVRLERTLQFGGDFAEPNYSLERPTRIAVSRAGDLYVLDDGESSVKVYDASGRFIRRFGRKGGGPGEFQWMTGLHVNSDVRVTDMVQRRMTIFSLDGQLLRTEPLLAPDDRVLGEAVPLRHGWNVGTSNAQLKLEGGGATSRENMQIVLYAFSRAETDTVFQYRSSAAAFHPRNAPLPAGIASTHLGQGGAYAVLGDSIVAVADGYTGSVRWYRATPAGLVAYRTRQLPSRSVPTTDADIRRIERRLRGEGNGSSLPRQLVFNAPPRSSIASEALFSDDGSLWVRNTPEAETGHVWTVFDRAGNISIRLQMPRGFDLKHVRGQNLYGFGRTSNDAALVQVYRMQPRR